MKSIKASLVYSSLLVALILPSTAFSEELSRSELSLQEKASQRLYPGGPDEDRLEVVEGASSATASLNRYQIEREVYQSLFQEEEAAKSSEDDQKTE